MPIFDYQCRQGHKHELLVKRADAGPPCPTCGDEMVKIIPCLFPTKEQHRNKETNLRVKVKGLM